MGNYAAVVLADKPIRYYRLGETSGTTALDQSTNLANGTLHGGVTVNQTGLLTADTNPCMLFDGSSGYISAATTGLPTGAHAFTLEGWIQPTGIGTVNPIILFIGTAGGANSAILWLDATHFNFTDYTNTGSRWSVAPVNGQTYHVVGTYNGTNTRLYVNGIAVGPTTAITFTLTYGSLYLGQDGSGSPDFAQGTMQEIAIYNSALSAAQVANHYLAGLGTINFPIVSLSTLTRDGSTTAKTRDGLSLTTKTRG